MLFVIPSGKNINTKEENEREALKTKHKLLEGFFFYFRPRDHGSRLSVNSVLLREQLHYVIMHIS
jgi:hypothetical protein